MTKPEINTWRDLDYTPSSASKLALTDRPNPSAEDAALGKLLVADLTQRGFNLVPTEQADFLLTYVLDENLETDYGNLNILPNPTRPPQTTGQIYDPIRNTGPVNPVTAEVRPAVYRTRYIRLYLYTNPKTHDGKFTLAWQGSIAQGDSVPAGHEALLLKTLLNYFGTDKNGPVKLSP